MTIRGLRGISLAGSSEGIGAEGSGSSNQCTRCGAGFSFLFNRRATCAACQLNVCRKCATWEAQAKNYLCTVCLQPPQDQPKHPPPPPAAEVEAGVRGHIESLVEGRLGGPIDQVNITAPNTQHPNWAGLFKTHHAALTQAVANLSYALQMSILNREVPPSSSPSVRHTQLSEALGRVIQESTMILPNNGGKPGYDPVASPEMPVEDYNSQTYEDILATAILNKVLEKCEGNHISGGEVTIELTQDSASTDTDSGCSGGHTENRSRGAQEERNSISEVSEDSFTTSPRKNAQNEEDTASSTILSRTGAASPDQGVASDDAWPEKAPLTFKIEEHFEEITTERLTEDEHSSNEAPEYGGDKYGGDTSDSCGSLRGSRTSLDSRNGRTRHSPGHHSRSTRSHTRYHREEADDHTSLLPALNFTLPDNINEAIRRVSFPELGADIVGESCLAESEEEVYPGDLVVDGDASWEENWLFQKNRLVGNRETQHDPVTMLIPNPNDSVVTTVGNRDIDELSDMSEIHSVCSLSTSTSDSEVENEPNTQPPQRASKQLSSLTDEIVAEFSQSDRDYTVYDSLPTHINPISKVRSRGQMRSLEYMESNSKPYNGYAEAAKPPVPRPRKISLNTSYPDKSTVNKSSPTGISKSFGNQSITSHSTEDLSILSPPLKVPSGQDTLISSETIWIICSPENATINHGRALRLSCQVNAKKPMGISWYHNGKLLSGFQGGTPHSPNIWMWRHGPSHHLNIYNTDGNTAGIYAVAAYTAKHTVWAFCNVKLKKSSNRMEKRPSITLGMSDHYVEDGGEVTLECQVTGHPEPRVIFYRGKDSLQPSRRVTIENDHYGTWALRLAECTPQDSTDYKIVATNAIGHTTARLRVNVLPDGSQLPNQYNSQTGQSGSEIQHGENNQIHFTASKHMSPASFTTNQRITDTSINKTTKSQSQTSYSDLKITKSNNDNQKSYYHGKSDDNLDGITQIQPKPGTETGPFLEHATITGHSQNKLTEQDDLREFSIDGLINDSSVNFAQKNNPLYRMHEVNVGQGTGFNEIEFGEEYVLIPNNEGKFLNYEGEENAQPEAFNILMNDSRIHDSSIINHNLPVNCSSSYSLYDLEESNSQPITTSTPKIDLKYFPSSHDEDSSQSSIDNISGLTRLSPSFNDLKDSTSSAFNCNEPSQSSDLDLLIVKSSGYKGSLSRYEQSSVNSIAYRAQHDTNEHSQLALDTTASSSFSEWTQGTASCMNAASSKKGTIAEREHRKWEEAVPLANNPYAPERLASRLNGSTSSNINILSHPGISVEFPDGSEVDLDPSLRSLRDGVASKADLNRYSRDYYIPNKSNHTNAWIKQYHQQEKQQAIVQNHQHHQTSSQKSLSSNSSETKVQLQQLPLCMPSNTKMEDNHTPSIPFPSISEIDESTNTSNQYPFKSGSDKKENRRRKLEYDSSIFGKSSAYEHYLSKAKSSSSSKSSKKLAIGGNLDYFLSTPPSHWDTIPSPTSSCNELEFENMTKEVTNTNRKGKTLHHQKSDPEQYSYIKRTSFKTYIKSSTPLSDISPSNSFRPISPSSSCSSPAPVLESPGIPEIESALQRNSFTRNSFRSRKASSNFALNPLFEDESTDCGIVGSEINTIVNARKDSNFSNTSEINREPSSDYYSSYESLPYLSSFSRQGSLKLPKPSVTEEVLESFSRRGSSFRYPKHERRLSRGGSFKISKSLLF